MKVINGWVVDEYGNRASVLHFGTEAAARAALASLVGCSNCVNCSNCSICSRCSNCSRCLGCSRCSRCSDCSRCSYCVYCSYCSDCSECSECSECSDCSDCFGWVNCVDGLDYRDTTAVIPVIANIDAAIADAVATHGLGMSRWHCGTTHCRAGWAVHLAGEAGYALEKRYNTELAAFLIYRASGSPIEFARFYDTDAAALADINARAGR